MTPDQDLSALLAELPSHWKSTAPRPHHRGEELLPIVYADPGSNGWYYRERKPDSMVAYVRLDHHERAVQAAVAKAVEASVNAENEACAKMLDNEADDYEEDARRYRGGSYPYHYRMSKAETARKYAAAIRSRGVAG